MTCARRACYKPIDPGMKKVYRSKESAVLAGICGGLGETYSVDPVLLRLVLILLCLTTGILPIGITYVVGWMLIPVSSKDRP